MTTQITLALDELDAQAIHRAIAHRQTYRDQEGCILPDNDSDLAGAALAEICRSWLESVGQWDWADK
jgi:hypothetical protein